MTDKLAVLIKVPHLILYIEDNWPWIFGIANQPMISVPKHRVNSLIFIIPNCNNRITSRDFDIFFNFYSLSRHPPYQPLLF